jgi:DNA polymerase-3 subunit delta'
MFFYPWHQTALQQLSRRAQALPHALLLRGANGIGKRAFARALVSGLLCETPAAALVACGHCEGCRWVTNHTHPDFRLVQPEGASAVDDVEAAGKRTRQDIAVAQIRALSDFINMSAHRKGGKVVLIEPAEAMNANAANALLKSLEEPPADTRFVLVSHRPHWLPATIRSRCQQIALTPPSAQEAVKWLREQGVTQPELALAQAGGAPVLAAELDTEEYWSERARFLESLAGQNFHALSLAERYAAHPLVQLVGWLQRWSYDLACVTSGQRVRYNPDWSSALSTLSRQVKALDMLRFHRDLVRFQRVLTHPLNARLVLEDWFLRYAQAVHG